VPDPDADLWETLALAVTPSGRDHRRIVVADSKAVYSPKKGLLRLEEEVLVLTSQVGDHAEWSGGVDWAPTLGEFAARYVAADGQKWTDYPWYQELAATKLPVAAKPRRMAETIRLWRHALAQTGVRFNSLIVAPRHVMRFNDDLRDTDNKSDAAFRGMRVVLERLWRANPRLAATVDRQGGRKRYGASLAKGLHANVAAGAEEDNRSSYTCTDPDDPARELDITFAVKADRDSFAVSVASMVAKYLRELCMRAINQWFTVRIPRLEPTAGYPQDAARWIAEVESRGGFEGIDKDLLIRSR
jgi:ribonuclease HII